jgi:hypothetical protein
MSDQVESTPLRYKQLFGEASVAELLNPSGARKSGRPRDDDTANRVARLRQSGKSWPYNC